MKRETRLFFGLVAMVVSGLLAGGCNNTPNTSNNAGPTILLTIVPAGSFTWPAGTPNLMNNGLHVLATSANRGGTIQPWFPDSSKPPTYDWLAIISPGDASGIESLNVNATFYSDCGGQGPNNFPATPWNANQTFGSSGGPVLAYPPIYAVELSPKVIGPYTCPTQTLPYPTGGEVGLYYITATSTNGNGKTTSAGFEIKIGNVDGINFGP
jgi:hypothetical protein